MMVFNLKLGSLRTLKTLLLALSVSACGERGADSGDSGNSSTLLGSSEDLAECSVESMQSWAYDNMRSYYLFADQVSADVRLSDYESAEELVTALRVQPYDRFSNIQDQSTQAAFFNVGENFGFGWRLSRNAQDDVLVSFIEPGSPLDFAGVQRGDKLISLDGYTTNEYIALPDEIRSNILGTGSTVVSPTLGFSRADGTTLTPVVTKAKYTMQTVTETKAIDHAGTRIGYLSFYQFVETSRIELANAFASLAAENITELVLDLRFNGGGRISVANELASYIIGNNGQDEVFSSIIYNDANSFRNIDTTFEPVDTALNLSRVYVLASENTCSASEMVINGLSPFIDVVTVGNTTCGKPYGTRAVNQCGKSMNAVEVEFQNANGFGGYFQGFNADCPVTDALSAPLGATDESLLATALGHINTGSCQLIAQRRSALPQDAIRQQLPDELLPPIIPDSL